MEPESDSGQGTEAVAGEEQQEQLTFQLEADPGSETGTEATEPAAPAEPQTDPRLQEALDRSERLERQLAEVRNGINPWLQYQREQLQRSTLPKKTLEQVKADPNATIDDLVEALSYQQNEQLRRLESQTEQTARRTASEQRIRGMLTDEALGGKGRSYDSLRTRHLEAIYDSAPWVRQAIAETEADPAVAEYFLALTREVVNRAKGDIPKAAKAIFDALDGKPTTAVTDKINQAANAAAARVLPGSRANSPGKTRSLKTGEDVWALPDEEFRALYNQGTRH